MVKRNTKMSRKKKRITGGLPVICFVAPRCCVRVIKQAIVLRDLGYKVHLITVEGKKNLTFFEYVYYYTDVKSLANLLKKIETDIDLWVVHNDPTWPTTVIRETIPNAPVIIDVHDSSYWYNDPNLYTNHIDEPIYWHEELVAQSCADGFVTPSKSAMFELKTRTKKPVAWVPPAVPRSKYSYTGVNFKGGLVSQGGHKAPDPSVKGTHFRDYTELYSDFTKHKHLYLYSPDFTFNAEDPLDKHYISIGNKKVHLGRLNYDELILELGMYTWNLVGNNVPHYVWQYSMPNKFFDAMVAGVPSVVFNCTQVKEIIDLFDIGIYVESVQELLDRWDEHREKRVNLMLSRKDLCMEAFIGQLIGLYDEVLG